MRLEKFCLATNKKAVPNKNTTTLEMSIMILNLIIIKEKNGVGSIWGVQALSANQSRPGSDYWEEVLRLFYFS